MSPTTSIEIVLNGSKKRVDEGSTVADLLRGLELPEERVAVELNTKVLPRKEFSLIRLQSADRVEIVTFVGGG